MTMSDAELVATISFKEWLELTADRDQWKGRAGQLGDEVELLEAERDRLRAEVERLQIMEAARSVQCPHCTRWIPLYENIAKDTGKVPTPLAGAGSSTVPDPHRER